MNDYHIYSIPDENRMMGEKMSESPSDDIENKFIAKIAEIVCESMDVGWKDKRIFESLLVNNIKDKINNRGGRSTPPGLLQQYLAHQLEEVAGRLKRDLQIPDNTKVEHSHATHAKLSPISDYIRSNWVRIEDINADGTFERINEKGLAMDGGDEAMCCDEDPGPMCESEG